MAQKERLRTFLAVELDEQLKGETLSSVEELRQVNPHFRFILPENWHLTLHFFGALSLEELEKAKKNLNDAVRNTAPFSIHLKGFGAFPSERFPRILWIGVEGNIDSFVQLKKEIDAAILKTGLPIEDRKFHPHLTIARSREEQHQKGVSFGSISFAGRTQQTVDHLTLFRSELLPGGAKYTVLETIFFKH